MYKNRLQFKLYYFMSMSYAQVGVSQPGHNNSGVIIIDETGEPTGIVF